MSRTAALGAAVQSASLNILLEVGVKMLTFVLKAVSLRYTSTAVLGLANMRLLLMNQTIVFLAREPFRRAAIGYQTDKAGGIQKNLVNLLWLVPFIGVLYSLLVSWIWISLLPAPPDVTQYNAAVQVYALSALVELCAEPFYIVCQIKLKVSITVLAQAVANLSNCVVTAYLLISGNFSGLECFCIGQMCYGLAFILVFSLHSLISGSFAEMVPGIPTGDSIIDRTVARTTVRFFNQSIIKQLLTEGEKYVMTAFNVMSFSDQGTYDIINNLGSLAARIVFKPVEDAGYLYFSHALDRNTPPEEQPDETMNFASRTLYLMLHFTLLLSSVVVVFGFSYSRLLLLIYGGTPLAESGTQLLQVYCLYVMLLAVNGTSECFASASMSDSQLQSYTGQMVVFSGAFLAASAALSNSMGAAGFIFANCLNMLLRILSCCRHIHRYFAKTEHRPLKGLIPNPAVVGVLLVCGFICALSEFTQSHPSDILANQNHLFIGVACFGTFCLTVWTADDDLRYLGKFFRPKRLKEE